MLGVGRQQKLIARGERAGGYHVGVRQNLQRPVLLVTGGWLIAATCDVCGLIKRSNHNCKGAPAAEKPCTYCVRAGEPCVRHGGERSSVRASKRYQARQEAAQSAAQPPAVDRIAKELPKPAAVVQTVDPEPSGSGIAVTVARERFRIMKMTAAELEQQLSRRKTPSKYQDILNVLTGLEIGEAILVPRSKISEDGLRSQVRALITDRSFTSRLDDLYLTIIRSK